MKKVLFSSVSILVILCCASAARADLRIKQKSTSAGGTSETVIATKGARYRYEMDTGGGTKIINLSQCDLKRTLTINEATKRYIVSPTTTGGDLTLQPGGQPPMMSNQPVERRGGVVTYTQTLTDTGERKQMFGFPARRIKTATQITSDVNACSPINQREETDGWYIDLNINYGCQTDSTVPRPLAVTMGGGCQDQIQHKQIGTAKLGYPLMVTRTAYGADGQVESKSTVEVIELSRAALDQSLFEVPADYTEAKSFNEMYAASTGTDSSSNPGFVVSTGSATRPTARDAVSAKPAGMIRVGVVQVINRAQREVPAAPLQAQLVGAISGANVDAVAISATAPAAIEAEARQKDCDFILYTDVTDLKLSAAKKLGGMFGKVAGVGSGGLDKTEARVEFRLMAVGNNAVPQLQSSASGKGDGDEGGAAAAIKKEAQMVVAEAAKKK